MGNAESADIDKKRLSDRRQSLTREWLLLNIIGRAVFLGGVVVYNEALALIGL